MLTLSRIFLHNWHRFTHHVIDVEDSLYLAGHNGSGKSSVLDAIQVVLVADLGRVRFNSSAQERSARNLDSYVRGKIGEGRLLRPGNTVAYVALEFTDQRKDMRTTFGVCIECAEGKTPERTYVILTGALDPSLFMADGRERSRRELRHVLRARPHAHAFDTVGEYRDEMLNRLGGLNERFFDLFLRALTFQPITNINEFVEQWLLSEAPLDIATLQRVVERLQDLKRAATEVETKVTALQAIVEQQREVCRLHDRRDEYTVLAALLRVAAAEQHLTALTTRISTVESGLTRDDAELADARMLVKGAEQARVEAEVRLRQSDVVRRRDELETAVRTANREANGIRERWQALRHALQQETRAIQPLLDERHELAEPDGQELRALVACVLALSPDDPPPRELTPLVEAAILVLDNGLRTAQEELFTLERRARELRQQGQEVEQELARLRENGRTYPREVERMRALLAPVAGAQPSLLCELLEIPDERWQDAVEAMLGQRRFTIIVAAERFDACLDILDTVRSTERLYDVGLLDLSKASRESRPAQLHSLARRIMAADPLVQAYVDTVLGDIITCDSVAELRRHRRAVTPEVMVYSEWTARAIPPSRYQPWFVGARAQRSQIEAREQTLQTIADQLGALVPQVAVVEDHVARLGRGRELSNLRQRLDAPLDDRALRVQIAEDTAALRALDLSGAAALEREVTRLRDLVAGYTETEHRAIERRATHVAELRRLHDDQQAASRERDEKTVEATEIQARHAHAAATAEALLAERLQQAAPAAAAGNAETAARNFGTRAANEQERLTESATAYNTRYQFAGRATDPRDDHYGVERERLAATELPRFKAHIGQAQREAEEELREHVLHRLRENILTARRELERINDALSKLVFHNERYRFRYHPTEDVREFYDLINDAQILGAGSLFESEFYARHKDSFDRFYEALTRAPRSDGEHVGQARLTDYRHYLSYDIEVTHADGRTSRLSKIIGHTSGGETQTPFYLTIAASFVQLYRINERDSRSTIRLVAFDEAFSKMDQDRIGATLELFQQFGLQIITATPLESCEYLVPKMCTNLVLTSVEDTVLIEPYRNYAAQLQESHVS